MTDTEPNRFVTRVGSTNVEAVLYGRTPDALVRISYADPAQIELGTDAYYPRPDIGVLWFREFRGLPVVSGMLARRVVPDAATTHALVEEIANRLLHTDDQLAMLIELVGAHHTMVESGEESLFIDGDGLSVQFQPIDP